MRRIVSVALLLTLLAPIARADNWPVWRGADQDGVAKSGESYPTRWSADENVAWRAAIPGRGGSTPVVWDDQVFVTTGADGNNLLLCLGLSDGEVRWTADLGADTGGKHRKGSGANPSPVTDGEHVFAYFRSGDLACVDFSGKVVWQTNLQEEYGEDTLWWDLGSSPVLTDSTVVVAVQQTGPSYVVALDKESGEEVWKRDRQLGAPEEAAQSYTTPLLTEQDGQELLLVLGADHLTAHDAATGEELWRVGGFNPEGEKNFRSIASPVVADGIAVCPYARGGTLTAVRLADGKVAWKRDDLGADVPTPAAKEGRVYVIGDKGNFECIAAETGETVWQGDLPRSRHAFTSSPLIAGGHIYLTREDGVTFVLEDGDRFALVATNALADPEPYAVASPVPVGGGLLFRIPGELVYVAGSGS